MAVTQITWTRLAPSPTGALHLGNARTFLINWAMARQRGWGVRMRIEDLDGPRVKRGSDAQAMNVLRWLGIDWDGAATYQGDDLIPYREALQRLRDRRLIYPCRCTRSEIAAAQSAPHGQRELRYPGTCRPGNAKAADFGPAAAGATESECSTLESAAPLLHDDTMAWRVRIPAGRVEFEDAVAGAQGFDVQAEVGDFVVASKAGRPAYQLAVVVDDARQGVGHVVRGDDLLASTARQLWLYRLLELGQPPCYYHLPLVVGEDGRRLAKRHGDTRIAFYREAGVGAERVVGLIAYWSGVSENRQAMGAGEFRERFSLDRLPQDEVIFSAKDHAWLLGE